MSGGTQAFEAIVADVHSPVYVVTTAAGDERDGCLVGDEVDKFQGVVWHGPCERSEKPQLGMPELGEMEAGHPIPES